MSKGFRGGLSSVLLAAVAAGCGPARGTEEGEDGGAPGWAVRHEEGSGVDFLDGGARVLRYVYADDRIFRPYFAHARTPAGVAVTRNHPPVEGADATDHAEMHPGIWLAFGELEGADFWRNRAVVRHDRFLEEPRAGEDGVEFAVAQSYVAGERVLCREEARYRLSRRGSGYLLEMDSRFLAEAPVRFGDQEEMGLGIRVATPMAVRNGGRMTDAAGRVNEKEIWGQAAAWCDYSGAVNGARAGIAVVPHRENPRPSRFHARDYGALVANPFALRAFGAGDPEPLTAGPDRPLRLRFAVYLHDGPLPDGFPGTLSPPRASR